MKEIFKAYDIRGIYGDNLTDRDAYKVGFYLSKFLDLKEVKIAHDKRNSYENLTKFLIRGFLDAGTKVDYLGLSSTPNFYFSLFSGVNSGVMVTASHNPKEYNGFKIIHNMESFDSRNGLFELGKLVEEDPQNREDVFEIISNELNEKSLIEYIREEKIKYNSILNDYVEFLYGFYERILTLEEKQVLEGKKLLLDFSSGVSSLAMSEFLKKTSLHTYLVNNIVDGNFPYHSPDPLKAKDFIKDLELDFDFACAFDGDGDRVVFYGEDKNLMMQDYVIATYIDYFSNLGKKKFVCDLRVSRIILDIAKEKNLDLKLQRVGRAFYQNYMKENKVFFGAELSGHLFFEDFNYLDNPDFGFVYMLKIYANELLKNKEIKFSEIFGKYKKYHKIEEVNFKVRNPDEIFEKLKKEFEDKIVSTLDGLSFDFGNFWFNIRKSNTEPIIRLNLEGIGEKEAKKGFNEVSTYFEE